MRHGTRPARSLLAVAVVAAVLVPAAATASYARVRQAGPVKVEGTIDNKFVPKDMQATADADGKVTIEFTSHGAHTIQSNDVKGFDSGAVNDGQTKTITFEAKPGTYAVYCLYHQSIGMTGTLTVAGGSGEPAETTAPTKSAEPTASAPAESVTPAAEPAEEGGEGDPAVSEDDPSFHVPGVVDNPTLKKINEARDAEANAVSGFKFFTFACIAFLFILGAAVLFSTRPRRSGR